MNTQISRLLTILFVLVTSPAWAEINPPTGASSGGGKKKCGGENTGGSSSPQTQSLEWDINVGLARYAKPRTLTNFGQTAYEKNGNLPNSNELFNRYFSSNPLQQRSIYLELSQVQISNDTFHPSSLFLQSEAIFETIKKPASGGFPEFIHQVLTNDAFTLIDVLPAPESGWRLRTWKRDAATLTKSGAFYLTTAFEAQTPLNDVTFKRPTGTSGNSTLIYIQKETTGVLSGTRTYTTEIVQTLDAEQKPTTITSKLYLGEGTEGSLLSQEDLVYSERGTKKWDYTITRETLTASVDASGMIGALSLTGKTREDYDDFSTSAIGGELGMKRLVSMTEAYNVPGQSPQTTTYTYIQSPSNSAIHGRLQSTVKPDGSWTYSEYSISGSSPVSIVTDYSGWKDLTLDQRGNARKTVTTISANESLSESFIGAQLISKSRTILGTNASDPITTAEKWDGNAWHVTTTAYYPDSTTGPSTGRIKWVENSDGTATTYTYATVGNELVTTARTGAGSRAGITNGTEVKTTYGVGSFATSQITKDIASGLITERWDTDLAYNGGFDQAGRPIKRIYNADVNDYDITQYACCGLKFSRDRMGASIQYFRDGLKRVYKTESRANDSAPIIATFTTIDGLTTTETRRFGSSDSLFLRSSTQSLDGLSHAITAPSAKSTAVADRPVTVTVISRSATGDTETTTYADGSTSIKTSYLDGQIKSISGTAVTDMTYDYDTHSEGGGGEKSVVNASGVITSQFRDLLGRISKIVSGANGTTTYTYHPLGSAAGNRTKLQSVTDGDGVVESYGYNSKGEQTTTSRNIPLAGGETAIQSTTIAQDVVSNVTLHGVSLGVARRSTETIGSTGIAPVTISQSYISRNGLIRGSTSLRGNTLSIMTQPDSGGIATRTTTNPDGTKSRATIQNGLILTEETLKTDNSVITSTSYAYDSFQRPSTVTDARTGPTTYSDYTEAGQPLTITTNANTQVTSRENDIMGRVIKTTLPDSSVTCTAYHPNGQVKVIWGSQTYPQWTVYDEQMRMTQLHTWKIAPTLSLATVPADPPSGSEVTTWIYGPATGLLYRKQYPDSRGTNYTYTPAGRLQTRTWARGVTTTYSYTHGLMTATDYSDATPDIAITYDSLGRQQSVTTALAKSEFAYVPSTLALDTETISYNLDANVGYDFTRVLDRSQDNLQRDTGWQLKNGATAENQVAYSYGATDGRLLSVGNSSQSFNYGYLANSSLISTVSGPAHIAANSWDATRNVLLTKNNHLGITTISQYDYTVNPLGQRIAASQTGTAFAASRAIAWGYDNLGQVVQADSSIDTDDRAYQYDSIGNRLKSADGLTLPVDNNYSPNSLNQYAATPYGSAGVPPAYDSDGNMTSGPLPANQTAHSNLAWDAENRLISTTVNGVTTTYQYDSQSRRISKTTNGATTAYVYDGWNPIAEYQGSVGVSPALSKINTWGMDLSGSMQGAGGVGGLLAVKIGSNTFYPTYDGNGNVSEYLDNMSAVTAHFEYDPFGRAVVDTDSSGLFEHRFSTKPLDSTTGLYYYGYRYFDPNTGRWASRDPIQERGGINLYGFVENDGFGNWDYLGLCDESGGGGILNMLEDAAEAQWNHLNTAVAFINDGVINAALSLPQGLFWMGDQMHHIAALDIGSLGSSGPNGEISGTLQGYMNPYGNQGYYDTDGMAAYVRDGTASALMVVYGARPPLGASVRIAANNASRLAPGGGLMAHEAEGGHLLAFHLGQSESQLASRLASNSRLSAASTFGTRAEAEAAISHAFDHNASTFSSWLSNGAQGRQVLNAPWAGGTVLQRGASSAVPGTGVRAVLQGNGSGGYHILTGFPTP